MICLGTFDGEIDSTCSEVLYRLIDIFTHDNLRSMQNAAIIDMRQVWQWIRVVMTNGYPDVNIREKALVVMNIFGVSEFSEKKL